VSQISTAFVLAIAAAGWASGTYAQDALASLVFKDGGMSIAEGGVLRCDAGQQVEFHLYGEDANMQQVGLDPHKPVIASSNPQVVRAAAHTDYPHIVNIRCLSDGEAWLTADAGGRRAIYPVLVGKARRQSAVTTPAPAASVP
jgi:hypothetical protein